MPPRRRQQTRRIETSGIPRRPDTSDELSRKVAEHFGIISAPERPKLPLPVERFTEVELRNPDLPIADHLDHIVETIDNNRVTICVAETGSGKSTQIPQALMQRGYKIVLTQPRRIAAEMVAARISDEVCADDRLGRAASMLVGFQTAERNTLTEHTKIAVVTDGLRLVQELGILDHSRETDEPEVLIIDEVHERNTNIDVLIAWTQKLVAENSNLRIVFTTASINAYRLARHYDKVGGIRTPIIEVPGRSFEIKKIEKPDSSVAEEMARLAREGKNALAFLPGLREIDDCISAVQRLLGSDRSQYHFQRLHGKLSPYEQNQIEHEVDGVRLVFATNVAETSITIPDVDAVVDSGLERRIEIDDETNESLRAVPISRSSCLQRSGRCGRTKPGEYVLTRLNKRVRYVSMLDRDEYSTPEILRSNVDKTVLSVACAGQDITTLDFLDNIDHKVILRSKRALRILGALNDQNVATDRGRRMNSFPVKPNLSRMIVYGMEQGFNEQMMNYLTAMVAAVESGGLADHTGDSSNEWKKLSKEHSSDLLAQLDIFIASQSMNKYSVRENDLNERATNRARELHEKLQRRLRIQPGQELTPPKIEERDMLIEAIAAGMIDFVYKKRGHNEYIRTSHMLGKTATKAARKKIPTLRSIGDRSVVKRRGSPEIVVANPYAIAPPPGKENLPEQHIIQDVTEVTPLLLAKVGLELCAWENDGAILWRDGQPVVRQVHIFRDVLPTGQYREVPATWSKDLAHEIVRRAKERSSKNLRAIKELKKESEDLYRRSGSTARISDEDITKLLESLAGVNRAKSNIMSVEMLDQALREHVSKFADMIPNPSEAAKIRASSPDFIDFAGLSFSLSYHAGKPQIAKITDDQKKELSRLSWDEFALEDGRDILIPHAVKKYKRLYTLAQFKQIYPYRGL